MDRDLNKIFATLQKLYAEYYGVANVGKAFSLDSGTTAVNAGTFTPSKEIVLNSDMMAFSDFLSLVNIMPRSQLKGGSFKIGAQGRNTRTNDTKAGQERRVGEFKPAVLNEYEMVKAHFDFGIHDDDLADMSEFPDWHDRYRASMMEAFSNDRQIIGFHGTHHAATSDLSTHELLEDVNIGWRELFRQRNASNVFTGDANGEVHIGKTGHYANLDHWVQDLYQGIPAHKRDAGMTAVIGDALMGMSEGIYYKDQGSTPSEKTRIQEKAVTGMYGGLNGISASYFPQNAIMITSLKRNGNSFANLSIYWQKGSWKRSIAYKPELERTIDWNARREAYHVEDLQKMVDTNVEKVIFLDVKDANGAPVEILPLPVNKWADL